MRTRTKRVTIKDVAKACDLSPMATSYAFRGSSEVSEDTQRRVQAMARKMGYIPDMQARGLRVGKSGLIALIATKPLDWKTIADCARGVREKGYELIIILPSRSESLKRSLELKCVEGIICTGKPPTSTLPAVSLKPETSIPAALKTLFSTISAE